MARKGQISIQDSVEDNEEFDSYLLTHADQLICLEVYSDFCGPCLATGHAIRKGKLEIGQDKIAMVKAIADKIDALSRFKGRSEPVFLFIVEKLGCQRDFNIRLQNTVLSLWTLINFAHISRTNDNKGKLTRAMFGANGIELCRIIEEELGHFQREEETGVQRHKWHIEEMLPEEAQKIKEDMKIEEEYREAAERLRILTLAARKRRVCERLSQHVKRLNFIMFWPHCHRAHYDLYEKWDVLNISIAGKEMLQLDEKSAKEALYMSDVDPNEACLYALFKGEVMVVLFKMFETDTRDFVALLRHALYEEIPIPKEDVSPEMQLPPVPAYERYAMISKTASEVRRDRYNAKLQKLRDEKEERDRLAAEQERMAREAKEERLREEKKLAEEERMKRIQAGLPPEPEPQPADVPEGEIELEGEEKTEAEVTEIEPTEAKATEDSPQLDDELKLEDEEKVEAEEEFHSNVEVEGEDYIPPAGLFVPGLYCPPNELAKANGLAFFFPKAVLQMAPIESEHLPPHVLVIFPIDKRHDVQEVVKQYSDEILAMGVFAYEGDDPFASEHIAYSIKQYDKMERIRKQYFGTVVSAMVTSKLSSLLVTMALADNEQYRQLNTRNKHDHLVLMVSRKRSLPLLQLAGLNPCYISGNHQTGADGRKDVRNKDRLALMVSRKRSLPLLQLAGLNPCYISADVTSGERDCLQMFPVGYGDNIEEELSVSEVQLVEIAQEQPQPELEPEAEIDQKEDDEGDEEEED